MTEPWNDMDPEDLEDMLLPTPNDLYDLPDVVGDYREPDMAPEFEEADD